MAAWRRALRAGLLFGVCAAGALQAAPARHPEERLAQVVAALQDGAYAAATRDLEALLQDTPNFRLAQLLYGHVLGLRSGARIGSPLADDEDPKLRELLAEYRQRAETLRALPPPGQVPAALLLLADEVRDLLVVDLAHGRAYLLTQDDDGLRVTRNLYAGIGRSGFGKQSEGDLRTPVGVYRITGWLPGDQLPPLYGAGALPLDYPNAWDRALGRTGFGIWLHGVPPDTYARAPRSSEGCVTFANDDMLGLKRTLARSGTPVLLVDHLEWVAADAQAADRNALLDAIERWRTDASATDAATVLASYADDFRSETGLDRTAFGEQWQQAAATRTATSIGITELSLFAYPGEPGLVVAQFVQHQVGDNAVASLHMEQYWRRQPDGRWQIVRESGR